MLEKPRNDPRLAQLAAELQRLHRQAGKPTYRELQRGTGYGRTVLSEAMNGHRLPTWPVMQALVQALGDDPDTWRPRWAATASALEQSALEHDHGGQAPRIEVGEPAVAGPDPGPVGAPPPEAAPRPEPASTWRSRRWPIAGALVAVAVFVFGGALSGQLGETGLQPARFRGGQCREVTAREDIRVFTTSDENNHEYWTLWPTGTRFWVDPLNSTPTRYRTVLRNGAYGWVGANPRYTPTRSCLE
jgi:hypothetical protein